MIYTPKQRMLNAYQGIASDRAPVAPEFWYYYPAKILGMKMVDLQREIPHWQVLQQIFTKYETEGWGVFFPEPNNPEFEKKVDFKNITENRYLETTSYRFRGKTLTMEKKYDDHEPSWVTKYIANNFDDIKLCIDMLLSPDYTYDFIKMNEAHTSVGEDYLLELWLGLPFFDFIAELIGFENAVMILFQEDAQLLLEIRERYLEHKISLIRQVCEHTPYEAFVVGCSASCNSLLGYSMWKEWDKPFLKEIAEEVHKHGKLIHIHFHGKSIEAVEDFVDIGLDCVCPFERPPGGDIEGKAGLEKVRTLLDGRVTMNGNVHTVESLIRGTADDVRKEVNEIKEVFDGTNRYIIGTGDQVGVETPEENMVAMIEEAKKI